MEEERTTIASTTEIDEINPPDQRPGIKVYDRPVRRGITLWILLLIILLGIALSWFAYQVIR